MCCKWLKEFLLHSSFTTNRPSHTTSDFSVSQNIWPLYPTEWKSKIVAKSAKPFWPAISAQAALPGFPGRAGLADLATNLDYHSVGYRGLISCDIEKLEQFYFRLTGPIVLVATLSWLPLWAGLDSKKVQKYSKYIFPNNFWNVLKATIFECF